MVYNSKKTCNDYISLLPVTEWLTQQRSIFSGG